MEDLTNLEDVLERQCNEVHKLDVITSFIKCKDTMKHEFPVLQEELLRIPNEILVMKQNLEKIKQQNKICHELLSCLASLDKKILHINENIPPELIQDYKSIKEKSSSSNLSPENANHDRSFLYQNNSNVKAKAKMKAESQELSIKDCKKTLFNEPEICPLMSLIDKQEFNDIPKYIIGRQTLEMLNSFINTLNDILKAKYSILHMGKAAARKKHQLDLYLHYKKQELSDENGHLYFFTVEDYRKHTNMKLDKMKLNLLTALRHCKRLREYRTGNELLRYVVMPH